MIKTITEEEYMQMFAIIGSAMTVHNKLGKGLAEAIYQESLAIQLRRDGITVEEQKRIACWYDDVKLSAYYIADFYCSGIMIELKSAEAITPDHRSQLFNYMRLTHTHKGLLINFGETSLRAERFVYQPGYDDFALLTKANLALYVDRDTDDESE